MSAQKRRRRMQGQLPSQASSLKRPVYTRLKQLCYSSIIWAPEFRTPHCCWNSNKHMSTSRVAKQNTGQVSQDMSNWIENSLSSSERHCVSSETRFYPSHNRLLCINRLQNPLYGELNRHRYRATFSPGLEY